MKRLMNRYAKSSKLSAAQFQSLVKLFVADPTASQIAVVSGLNRNTANHYLRLLRANGGLLRSPAAILWHRRGR